ALALFRAILLLAALILLGVAVYRMARSASGATPAFARAFVALAACIIVTLLGKSLGDIEVAPLGRNDQVAKAPLPKMADQLAAFKHEAKANEEKPLLGRFALL